MPSSDTSYIYRGRFQPFCRDYYEAILGFYLEFAHDKGESLQPDLILWVVRHIRTSALTLGILENEHDFDDELFRHIVYFNPFRFHECIKEIRLGLVHYTNEDITKVDPDEEKKKLECFLKWANVNVHPISIPISISEMTEYIDGKTVIDILKNQNKIEKKNGKFHQLLKHTQPKVFRILESSNNDDHNSAWGELAKMLAARVTDSFHPNTNQFKIFLPIFDKQDIADSIALEKSGWSCELRYMHLSHSNQLSYTVPMPKDPGHKLCTFNAYIFYAFILSLEASNDNFSISQFNLDRNILREFLIKRSTQNYFDSFVKRVNELLEEFKQEHFADLNAFINHSDRIAQIFNFIAIPNYPDKPQFILKIDFPIQFEGYIELAKKFIQNSSFIGKDKSKNLNDNGQHQIADLVKAVTFFSSITLNEFNDLKPIDKENIESLIQVSTPNNFTPELVNKFFKIITKVGYK
jgi:hypothetical protein